MRNPLSGSQPLSGFYMMSGACLLQADFHLTLNMGVIKILPFINCRMETSDSIVKNYTSRLVISLVTSKSYSGYS